MNFNRKHFKTAITTAKWLSFLISIGILFLPIGILKAIGFLSFSLACIVLLIMEEQMK